MIRRGRVRRLLPWRWLRREEGNATIQFVLVLPLFLSVILIGFESGLMLARQVMLDRALDIAVRDLRLGAIETPTHDDVKNRICDNTAIIRDCRNVLLLELAPVDTTDWALPGEPPSCVDRDEEIVPVTQFLPGAGNQLMLVRACFVVDPLFPTSRLGLQLPLDASGGFQMRSASSFVNEPR